MTSSLKVVIAIYPDALGFGFAIIENPQNPIDCGVVKVRPISNRRCLVRMKKMLYYYQPTLVILQSLKGKYSYKGKRVSRLLNSLTSYCIANRLTVKKYSREQIRFAFAQFNAKSRYAIAKTIVKWLPQYAYRMPKFRKPWMAEDYNMGMFDALSLAITHFYIAE
jgi:hypothetical protein